MIDIKIAQEIVAVCEKILPDAKIYLFGSYAQNNAKQSSDIDILVDMGARISFKHLGLLKLELEESNLNQFVDISDRNSISDDFFNQIKSDLIRIN